MCPIQEKQPVHGLFSVPLYLRETSVFLLAFYGKSVLFEKDGLIPSPFHHMFILFLLFIIIGSMERVNPYVNVFLDRYGKYIRTGLLVIAFASLGLLIDPGLINTKETGKWALELLWIILFIPILAKVFNRSLAKKFIPWRKELGILMGMLGLVHGLQYFAFGGIIASITSGAFWSSNFDMPFFAVGFIAMIISTLLLATSNLYSQKKLKKYWKHLHRLVYPLIILVLVHVMLVRQMKTGELSWDILIPTVVYFALKILEWRNISFFAPKKESA